MTRVFPPLGILFICLPFFLFDSDTRHPSLLTLFPVLGSMMVIWFCQKGEFVTRVLSTPLFVGIGLISYGLYIWHFPAFAFSKQIFVDLNNAQKLVLLGATFALTTATYFAIERPFRSKAKVSTRWLLTALMLATIVSLIAVSTILAAFAMSDLIGRPNCFAMMEPFLPRLLRRSGIIVHPAGEEVDYHGIRAPYYFETDETVAGMAEEMREFYQVIHADFLASATQSGNKRKAQSRARAPFSRWLGPWTPVMEGAVPSV